MRALGWLLFVVVGCQARSEPAPMQPDAGPRVVTVFLGQPVTASRGDRWPRGAKGTLSMHELKGPLDLTVVFPSGRTWRTPTSKALGKTDDHHWPTVNDPPETRVPNLESISIPMGEYASWDLALDASLRLAEELGVEQRFRDAMNAKIRSRPVPSPNYPLEGCVTLTTGLRQKGTTWRLEAQLYLSKPGSYRLDGWPDTCGPDAGVR
ncbi:MAG: hypothetical protein Q8S33_13265 [Myxococcales bacterium]|nr:hypothetical protein [Myxococcales bacterium]